MQVGQLEINRSGLYQIQAIQIRHALERQACVGGYRSVLAALYPVRRSMPDVMSRFRHEHSALFDMCGSVPLEEALEAEWDAHWLNNCRLSGSSPFASCERLLKELRLYRRIDETGKTRF